MIRSITIAMLVALVLSACGSTTATNPASQPTAAPAVAATAAPEATAALQPTAAPEATAAAEATAAPQPTTASTELREITVAMPYIPNVQFAQFYVADKQGYYAAQGLKVKFDYNFETDVVQRVAQGTVQFGMASGDSILLARANGLPVMTVATVNQQFPAVFFSKAEENIKTPADLKGKSVGIPGHFGASYIGLLAILYASKMQESDLNVQDIGFAQVPALTEGKVQVASGYGNNEPVQLEQQGIKVNVIKVSDFYPLASDGIITAESLIKQQPDLVRGFVQATLKGMRDVIANPDAAFNTALEFIPELKSADAKTQDLQRKVLQATLPYWQSDATAKEGMGFSNAKNWDATYTFMRDSQLLKSDVDLGKAFTNEYIQ
jgi:NitT/TauT family transport system substrate-binding protein